MRGHRRADAAHTRGQTVEGQAGGYRQCGDGDGDGTECDGRGIGQQADGGGAKRRYAQAGEHCSGDGDRCSEARRAFDKGAECKGDQEGLNTRVAGEVADGIFQYLKGATFEADAVEQNGGEDDPPDGEYPEGRAVGDGGDQVPHGHSVGSRSHNHGGAQANQRSHPGRLADHAQQYEKRQHGRGSDECGKRQVAVDRKVIRLPHE